MAMYKDTDITAPFIAENFPSVHAEIMASAANNAPAITAESLKTSHPDVVATIMEEGKASVDVGSEVTKERERITSIQALSRPGAEEIINNALADSSKTANDVKIELFDHDQGKLDTTLKHHKDNGKKLAEDLKELNNPEDGDQKPANAKEKRHDSMMSKIKGGKK
ncbi:hypothetical protein PGH07_07830 [Sulfurovum sp. zt1-1]|uniref:Uncharacterized protein n=1 Tax=Sulfurovum zhangzhouensis TaxID=3019067 RepID=A0ABT7QZ83_9BACT|nr:hypothetical protein [Sulfurovum zhangzhouensis]MDM5272086.1 hypothetical protein [Sulfurovum zhangzhouensis]